MSLFYRTARRRIISAFPQCSSRRHLKSLAATHHFDSKYKTTAFTTHTLRFFSSNSDAAEASNSINNDSDDNKHQYSLLYQRSPSRSSAPRTTLAFSSFNTLYWTWYTFDFTPSVNASAHEKAAIHQIDAETLHLLLVDPTMGYIGLGVALLIWGGSLWYPRHLVSAIWKRGDSLALSTMRLPLVKLPGILQEKGGGTLFTMEQLQSDSNIQFYTTDEINIAGDKETNEILIKLDGDLNKKRGHLALQLKDPNANDDSEDGPISNLLKKNYLLDIDEGEIVEGANGELLEALLSKDLLEDKVSMDNNASRRSAKIRHESEEEIAQIRPKFGKGKRRR